MTVSDFVARAYLLSQGKVSSLTSADKKWTKLVQLGNYYKNGWAREPGVDWRSTYQTVSNGTVTATDTFALDSSIYKIPEDEDDPIRIEHTDGTYSDWQIIPAEKMKLYSTGNYCSVQGSNLVFNNAFTSTSPQFGGTIKIPAYVVPDDFSGSSDVIPVDDPEWLATRVAAEDVRTDIVRQNQYPNLIQLANELMKKMKENNRSQVERVTLRPAGRGKSW